MDTLPTLNSTPPSWSLDVGFVGRGAIILAIAFFLIAGIGWLLVPRQTILKKVAARAFTAGCVSLFAAFTSLAVLFVNSRFEFAYVWEHADSSNALPYRIAGIWAGQQGSFLLWACCSALFALFAMRGTGELRRWFTIAYSGFLVAISGILAYESPFGLNLVSGQPFAPENGVGLSPALQNYWVTIHPPVIFLGFGALTVLAAYSFAAMLGNKVDVWAPMVRPWALIALTLTGVGLCMGGFWAYETLGWGGFWMWDPVENVSFVPWVFTAAFVHGIMVQVTKKGWRITNLLLGGLPFLLFVYGTFLTRSGVLGDTSVHSFANMDSIALKLLLGFMVISSLSFFGIWGWRAMKLRKEKDIKVEAPAGLHREGMFRLGAWMLAALGLGAGIGMSWPFFMAITGQKPKVVEEGLYHHTLTWMYIPLMLAMALGPLVAWRGMGVREFSKRIYGVFCITVAVIGLMMMAVARSPWTHFTPEDAIKLPFGLKVGVMPWILFLVSLSIFVIVANAWRIAELIKRSKMSAAAFLSHVGVAVLMAGLIISRGFEQKAQIQVQEGKHDSGLGYFVAYKGMTSKTWDRQNKILFDVQRGKEHWTASPGLYYVEGEEGPRPMVWPHIENSPFYDIYFALQPPSTDIGAPITLEEGKPAKLNGVDVTLVKRTQEGDPGKTGAKWGAVLRFTKGTFSKEVHPTMELETGGIFEHPAALDDEVNVVMKGMDAGGGAITIQLAHAKPVYPIDMYFKPMTILVWLGTAILAFSGLLSAWYRRLSPAKAKPALAQELLPQPKPAKKRIPVGV